MAVTEDDVRHIATLARLGIPAGRMPALVAELNQILGHMEVLSGVDTKAAVAVAGVAAGGTLLRADTGPQLPLARSLASFAPEVRDGFLMVPRLATHEDAVADEEGTE